MLTLLLGIICTGVSIVSHMLWRSAGSRLGYPNGNSVRPKQWVADGAQAAVLLNRMRHRQLDFEEKRRELNLIVAEEFGRSDFELGAVAAGAPLLQSSGSSRWDEYSGIDSVKEEGRGSGNLEPVRALISKLSER